MGRKTSWAGAGNFTESDINTYLMNQVVTVCTSTTRPSPGVKGMTVYETDLDRYSVCTVAGTPGTWRTVMDMAWQPFTPDVRFFIGGGGSGWSITGGYKRTGAGLIDWRAEATFTVSAIMSGQLCVTLPFVPLEPTNLGCYVGSGRVLGIARKPVMVFNDQGNPGLGLVELSDGTQVAGSSSSIWGSTVGGYCAVGLSGRYRAADA